MRTMRGVGVDDELIWWKAEEKKIYNGKLNRF